MRFLILAVLALCQLNAGSAVELDAMYGDSSKCKACHHHIIAQWESSWHAKSHYKNDEYFRKSVDYISRKSRRSGNAIQVGCAACHNPRIAVTQADVDYEIMVAMKLDEKSEVNKALQSDLLSEGINCVVCHNIDKIHADLDDSKRGVHRVSWMKSGTMVGPLEDAFSPYHKVENRDFFNEQADTLCLVCHANDRSEEGLVFTDMQSEYRKGEKMCVDCHMSPRHEGVASTLRIDNGQQKKRMVRDHLFAGGHVASMWNGALTLEAKVQGDDLVVTLINPQPHNIPSGFGARELIIEVDYLNGSTVIERQSMSLTRTYTSKRGKPTIPHLAEELGPDMSVPAQGKKIVKFPLAKGIDTASITLYYRLVNDEVRTLLELQEPIWSEKMLVNSLVQKL